MDSFVFARLLLLLVVVWTATPAQAQDVAMDWSAYDGLLAAHVTPGERNGIRHHRVDYLAVRQDPRYAQALALIANFPTAQITERNARLAFYINAYNLYAIKMVIDHLPLESIRDAGSLFSPVWGKEAGSISGQAVTLDEIEHEILRPMGEPRVHFAIVCASLSCPNLRAEAFTAEKLEQQLDDQTRSFLQESSKGLALEGDRVRVSQIFDWFGEDFDVAGGVETFLRRYRELPASIRLRADLPYDWSLNSL
ncbi:MAG: DUF547 domain-containing protein [Gammaproteobacteria bacterium]|nr:DUF547 domain-containing protein [Gammaproteobacteria bacterium]